MTSDQRKSKYQVIIKSNNKIISKNAKLATSFIDKSLGLIINKDYDAIIFETRFGIHTFGMKKEIDIVVLDNKNRVVRIKDNLKPNRFFFWNLKFNTVTEFRKKVRIKVGDLIQFTK